MNTVTCFAVITEEREAYPPHGSGALIHSEIVSVHRHHARAMAALEAEREQISKYLSSRFRAYLKTERVEAELAEKVSA